MATTTNLGLELPAVTSTNKVREDFNDNMNLIDAQFAATYLAPQLKAAVSITGGSITGITPLSLNPTRTAGQYWSALDISDGSDGAAFTAETPAKTYIFNTEVRRLATTDMTGDSRDVMFKGVYRNYGQNDASSNAHGIGVSVRNESGGTMGTLKGGEFALNTKSGATTTTAYGATITVENYGTVSTLLEGLRIDLRN